MFDGTYEDELKAACDRMGYRVEFKKKDRVVVDLCTGSKRDRHVFKNATHALIWVEARERSIEALRVVR